MPEMNEDPVAYWNEEAGARWVRAQGAVDRMVAPLTARLMEATDVQPGEHVIDVGCGCGSTTLEFARRVGKEGRVIGVDVSKPMLEQARARSAEISQVMLEHADAQTHVFEPGSVDLVTSRFGIMFFTDPVRAFANLRTSLRDRGRFVAMCWQAPEHNPWLTFIPSAFPDLDLGSLPGPEDGPGPFSLSSPARVHEILGQAGFSRIDLEPFAAKVKLGETVDEVFEGLTEVGPFARILAEAADDQREALLTRARTFLDAHYRSGPPLLDAAVWIVVARP